MTHSEKLVGRLTSPKDVCEYAMAGKSTFTLKNMVTGNRFTFKINKGKPNANYKHPIMFVSVLTGSDVENWKSFTYLGTIIKGNLATYKYGKKSKISSNAMSAKTFAWFCNWMNTKSELPKKVEIWHEGVCGRCGRKLTVPESIERGIGPECDKLLNG